eukprot:TRINITY_DN1698_c1_g3_i1.p1 TRINITY_DN1698_c1_g3~~TRINITY_DN1698_c1_g3_i1.p1  ORF type:complete len:865 (+),score=159.23 TRINITY_DN1698_c1_g3_i1:93-2687(+)
MSGDEAPQKVYDLSEMEIKEDVAAPSSYRVKENGKIRKEAAGWETELQEGRLVSKPTREGSASSPLVGSPSKVAFQNEPDQDSATSSSEDEQSTVSSNEDEWLDEQSVHWKWTTFHLVLVAILTVVMLVCIGVWAATTPAKIEGAEFPHNAHLLACSETSPAYMSLGQGHPNDIIEIVLWFGPEEALGSFPNATHPRTEFRVELQFSDTADGSSGFYPGYLIGLDQTNRTFSIEMADHDAKDEKVELRGSNDEKLYARLAVHSNNPQTVAFAVHVIQMHKVAENRVVFATLVLLFVYTLIVFELVDRTLSAMIGSFVALTVLGVVKERPNLETVINWIDFETVLLLFGMMVMVRIFSLTGVFEYCAVKAYKWSKGDIWTLTLILCTFTAVTSAFLDNVTTMLLLTPVTCRLCKILKIDPTMLLLAEVMFSNVGGAATAIGDPPNIIIVNDREISSKGIEFAEFTLHMMIGSVMITLCLIPFVKWRLKDFLAECEAPEAECEETESINERPCGPLATDLRNSFHQGLAPSAASGDVVRGMSVAEQSRYTYYKNHPRWNMIELSEQKDAVSVSAFHVSVTVDHYKHNVNNDLLKRILIDNVQKLESEIRVSEIAGAVQLEQTLAQVEEGFDAVVRRMEEQYKIVYQSMFYSIGVVLTVVVLFFFIHSGVHDIQLDLAWIAILGAIVALIVSGIDQPEKHVLAHVEWGTLLFFAALFVLMEALTELGLIEFLGDKISEMINSVDGETEQMVVAIVVLVWVSAFASAFIDNIPYTTAMVPVIVNVAESTGLALKPLVFALAFGTCLGGNGTLIGASANVVTVGIAKEAYGNEISFVQFMKFGMPVMVMSIFVATIYLLIVHPAAGWNM